MGAGRDAATAQPSINPTGALHANAALGDIEGELAAAALDPTLIDRHPALDPAAALAVRTQRVAPDTADEGRIAARVAEGDDLVEQRRQPQVRVIEKARPDVPDERFDRIGRRSPADPGPTLTGEIGAEPSCGRVRDGERWN